MKVEIGKHKGWFGPHQLAESICFWAKWEVDEYGHKSKPDWVYEFGDWLAYGNTAGKEVVMETWLFKLLFWINGKRKRKISIRIDEWDSYDAYTTLGLITLPLLKQLRDTKMGAPLVDDEDVPEELRSTSAPAKENEYDIDANHFKRWEWVLDQIIWAFEHIQPDIDWGAQFYTGTSDVYFEENGAEEGQPTYQMKHGPQHTLEVDEEGLKQYREQIDNGFRLFGKYYQNLWA